MGESREGIGCELCSQNGEVFVSRILHGSPAQMSSALAVGDAIVKVDGWTVSSDEEAEERLGGESSRPVTATVRFGSGRDCGEVRQVMLVRQRSLGQMGMGRDGDGGEEPVGVGATLTCVWEGILVDNVITGGPAWLSGVIHPGDIITSIGGEDVGQGKHLHPGSIAGMMRGKPGTRLTLGIVRGGCPHPIHVDIVRGHALDVQYVKLYRELLSDCVRERSASRGGSAGRSQRRPVTVSGEGARSSKMLASYRGSAWMSGSEVGTKVFGHGRGARGGGGAQQSWEVAADGAQMVGGDGDVLDQSFESQSSIPMQASSPSSPFMAAQRVGRKQDNTNACTNLIFPVLAFHDPKMNSCPVPLPQTLKILRQVPMRDLHHHVDETTLNPHNPTPGADEGFGRGTPPPEAARVWA